MENVFEPMNFAGDVFEPMGNFGGDVFEPMNFEGDYSNFAILNCGCKAKFPFNKSKREECLKKCNNKKAEKKASKTVSAPAPTTTPAPAPVPVKEDTSLSTTPDGNKPQEKFLGMPKKLGIGVTIGIGVLAIGLTTFFLLRKK